MRVKGDKEIAFVLIDFGPLPKMAAIFDTERVELKGLLQSSEFCLRGVDEIDPEQATLLNH